MIHCYCSQCSGIRSWATVRTLKIHMERDIKSLSLVEHSSLKKSLEACIARTQEEISNLQFNNIQQQEREAKTKDIHFEVPMSSNKSQIHSDISIDIQENPVVSTAQSPCLASLPNVLEALLSDDDFSDDGVDQFQGNHELSSDSGSDDDMNQDQDQLPIFQSSLNQSAQMDMHVEQPLPVPKSLIQLRQELLGDYILPQFPPMESPVMESFTQSEQLSLQHYTAWSKSNGTVLAYNKHKEVLESASGIEILSLYRVRKLAASITGFHPNKIDMCPKSCIAYTGSYKDLTHCPYQSPSSKQMCGAPRYKDQRKKIPVAQVTVLPVMDTIRALFANADTSRLIRNRDQSLKAALHVVGTAINAGNGRKPERKYSDFGNSVMHEHQHAQGFFKDERDIALALSTDGAQLTLKKHSNTWLLILVILNLPAEIRYMSGNVILNLATPGPNSPGDIESFMRPLFEEMACASEGLWMWDALDSAYFTHRAYIAIACGDMLGSAKINGMAGHTGHFGDRFSEVEGAKASLKKGSKALYYPVSPPQNEKYNPERPKSYNLTDLPIRTHATYLQTITSLEQASSKAVKSKITRATGVSRLPLCAASPLFLHPTFFPLDPFHLFYENCVAFIWDLWTVNSIPGESIHMSPDQAQLLGSQIPLAMSTLPPAFCGPVRDPYLKRQSQYKVYEWMALLHWYILPIGMEISMDSSALENFSHLVNAIETAMTIQGHSEEDLKRLHTVIRRFLTGFEALYVGNNPENISRCRLCIFQLIHVPMHIKWHGSIRICSQSTCERSIGEVEHKIRSKKAPFANLANIITEKELIRVLHLYYPSLVLKRPNLSKSGSQADNPIVSSQIPFTQQIPVRIFDKEEYTVHLALLSMVLELPADELQDRTRRWGKAKLSNGRVLRSKLSDSSKKLARSYRWFEARIPTPDRTLIDVEKTLFGEAVAFYSVHFENCPARTFAVVVPLIEVRQTLGQIRGNWSETLACVELKHIVDLVGIWKGITTKLIYILRKHPALALLSERELGNDFDLFSVAEEDQDT